MYTETHCCRPHYGSSIGTGTAIPAWLYLRVALVIALALQYQRLVVAEAAELQCELEVDKFTGTQNSSEHGDYTLGLNSRLRVRLQCSEWHSVPLPLALAVAYPGPLLP